MKKYPFNPTGKFGMIAATIVTFFMTAGTVVFGYMQSPEIFRGSSAFEMIIATCLIPGVLLLVLFIDYLIKDSDNTIKIFSIYTINDCECYAHSPELCNLG